MTSSDEDISGASPWRWPILGAGPLAGALLYGVLSGVFGGGISPAGLSDPACRVAAVAIWMGIWWLGEALPLAATAMLPLVLYPLLKVMPIKEAAAPFGDDLIFLFLGGFFLQLAMERWGLHRRLALLIIIAFGTGPVRLVGGLMLATAVLSMWISNAAAAAMMLPIGMSLCQLVAAREGGGEVASSPHRHVRNLGKCVMIGIAWAATIGGIATPIGTAPNVLLRGYLKEVGAASPSFAQWMILCCPMAAGFLVLAWLLLTRVFFNLGAPMRASRAESRAEAGLLRDELAALGPVKPGEWATLGVFGMAVVGWLFGEQISFLLGIVRVGAGGKTTALITDPVVAMLAGLLLFVIPVSIKKQVFVLDWKHAGRAPYGVLLLFGGGLALAKGIEATGLDKAIGSAMAGVDGLHPLLITLIVTGSTVFLSEFMSNTALTATLLPIVGGLATALHVPPVVLLMPMTLGASCAFMLPAGTPPSAITFSSGYYGIKDMAWPGLLVDAIGVGLIGAVLYFGMPWVLGVG